MSIIQSSAVFSTCKRFRYSLSRIWSPSQPTIVFIGLNPSTADETHNDPTVRRCIGFARDWKFGGMVLINLFAYRSPDPMSLKSVSDPVGPRNDSWIRKCCDLYDRVVVAWGIHGTLFERDADVLRLLSTPYCLGVTKMGAPKHPLYLSAGTRLTRFERPISSDINQ